MKFGMFCERGAEALVLLFRKTVHGGDLHLTEQITKYSLAPDTKIRIGNRGHLKMGGISTEANVHLTAWGGELKIGSHCSFNRNDIVVCRDRITIGDGTVMGPNVGIYDHDHVFGAKGKIDGEYNCSPIIIGNNVWIGAGVIVLRGSSIGDNCVIGAGTVISGKIPPNSLVTAQTRAMNITPLRG